MSSARTIPGRTLYGIPGIRGDAGKCRAPETGARTFDVRKIDVQKIDVRKIDVRKIDVRAVREVAVREIAPRRGGKTASP
ncbi:hypothetical protein GCM10009530_59080 [Microbispora corallina]|uniref:Uncharacterized protein n=1 Tax=Microbispora corallina TaxID=83302 RepID=A0ABQ4G041_9ACTN|nr:hypothetical protein Mco01_34260 [Microbispora corallina]